MIADTTFLIDLQQERASGRAGPALAFLRSNRGAPLRITAVSVAECSAGFPNSAAARFFLEPFPIIRLFPEAAYEAGNIDREQMTLGRRLGENDTLIAGIARYYGEPLLSNDVAFRRVRGLRVISY